VETITQASAAPGAADLPPRPVSPWLTIPVILLCLGGGGWMLHWYINAGDLSPESRLLQVTPTEVGRANGAPPAIQQQDNNSWSVHGREAVAVFFRPAAGKPFTLRSLSYANYQFVPQDQRDRIFAARRLSHDPAVARSLKMTDDQTRQLRALTGAIGIIHPAAESAELVKLWTSYQSAANPRAKQAAEAALLARLTQIATKNIDPTRSAAADRAKKIKAVLSDSQWKQFDTLGR
jgi:hypothetical protein